jgi:hypothetical protein
VGERIKDRMYRLYREYQEEQQAQAAPASTASASEAEGDNGPRATGFRENIDSPASPDELRRARTHRLIQVGAICDQYMGTRDLTPDQVITLLSRISKLENVQEIIG